MSAELIVTGVLCFFVIATLYSSIGHAGASGYLAVMALLAFPGHEIKPIALILNIIVASIGSYKYINAGYFDKKVFWLFAAFSIPSAFIGGYFNIDERLFKLLAGIFLVFSAIMIALKSIQKSKHEYTVTPVPPWKAGLIGSSIGYVSGLIGIGGGIFLSPVLLLFHWASPKQISGISALFILVNSLLGLLGHLSSLSKVPDSAAYWAIAVVAGGYLGSHLGTRKIKPKGIYIVLSIVLITAGVKMLIF